MLDRCRVLHILERRVETKYGVLFVRVVDRDEASCFRRNRAEDPVWREAEVRTLRSEPYFGVSEYFVKFEPHPE